VLAGKAVSANMEIATRAFFPLGVDLAAPEKFHAAGTEALLLLQYMVRRDDEIEPLMNGMAANE